MKKYLAILSSILIITSCDVEDGPFITDYDSYVNPEKKVLIEDFTGHLCPNCPDAARELDAIHDIYGNQIIGIAIHVSKSFARPYPASQAPSFQYDFRTNWGDELDGYYGISAMGLPRGMVNRIGFPDNHKLGKDEWASTVALELKKDVDFTIHISSDENSISITSEVKNNISSEYNLVVCLTESNIINWQKDGQDNIEDYQHNHVLRTVLIDESLSSSSNYVAGQQIETLINYDLTSLEQFNIDYSTNNTAELGNGNAGDWNTSNMSVIAYIYNTTTKEIVQVEESHLNN
jgi:hypothetical protein